MPTQTDTLADRHQQRRYKMKLTNNEFMSEHGNWLKKGDVVTVDEDTAVRWLEHGIATQAGNDEQTAAEKRRAKLLAQLTPLEDDEDEDEDEEPRPRRRAVRREPEAKQPVGRVQRRGRAATPPELVGGGVLNSLDDVPDQHTTTDEDEDDD